MASSVEENQDLLDEILLGLPVKALMRFKCVSKNWLSHISNPCFCHSHTLHQYHTLHPFPSALLVTPKSSYNYYLTRLIVPSTSFDSDIVPYTPMITDFQFLNVMNFTIEKSCNGLLLIKGHSPTRYFVCNPITKQLLALVLPTQKYPSYKPFQFYLAFNPLSSSHYKVIFMRFKESYSGHGNTWDAAFVYESEINVYSSKTGCWSDFGVCLRGPKHLFVDSGIYCNGVIYWYTDKKKSRCFDVENQCFKTFPMPPNIKRCLVKYFGESGGHLHMIHWSSFDGPSLFFHILELKEDHSGWSVRFIVDLRESFQDIEPKLFHVLCIFRQEKEEDSVLVFSTSYGVISYNLLDHTFRRLTGFNTFLPPIQFNPLGTFQVLQYFENLSWDGASSAFCYKSYDSLASK